jgi:hypothetical protein
VHWTLQNYHIDVTTTNVETKHYEDGVYKNSTYESKTDRTRVDTDKYNHQYQITRWEDQSTPLDTIESLSTFILQRVSFAKPEVMFT